MFHGYGSRVNQTPFDVVSESFPARSQLGSLSQLSRQPPAGGEKEEEYPGPKPHLPSVHRPGKRRPERDTLKNVKRIPGRHFLRNLVERRALVAQLVRRDFETRYVGSAAGWMWGIVHPLVQLAVWIFVFQMWLQIPLDDGELTKSYPLFLFCGFLPWMLFNETVTRSAGSLVEQANLITKTVFPSEVVPVSIFLSSLIHHLIATGLAIAAVAMIAKTISPMVLLLPVYMFFVGLLGVGIGWIAASLHVYLRDTGQALAVIMTLWFWVTPIMFSSVRFPPQFHALLVLNPMFWVVNAYRERLLSSQWPGLHEFVVLAAYSGAVFIAGGLFFRYLKRGFADVL